MSEQRRINVVQVELSSGKVVDLDWDARQGLLKHLGSDESMRPLIKAFTDAGTSRPVIGSGRLDTLPSLSPPAYKLLPCPRCQNRHYRESTCTAGGA